MLCRNDLINTIENDERIVRLLRLLYLTPYKKTHGDN